MTIDQLKALAGDQPFRPFVLETIGGNRIGVPSAGAIVFPPPELPYKFDLIFIYASDGLVHHITAEGINSYAFAST
jgi:hypothetical protein